MGLILGIDIGTLRSKAVACDLLGRVVARAVVAHGVSIPGPGRAEHDADATWWADLVALCRRLAVEVRMAGGVDAVAITTCGPCIVPLDADGRPLRPAILYGVDQRAAPQIAAFEARHGRAAIEQLSWTALSSQSAGPKIAWIAQEEPGIHARAAEYHTATSYLVRRLTGVAAIDRHQGSYLAPFIDARRGTWDLRFADDLDLDGRLPPLRWPEEMAGTVTAAAAVETGLPAGIPVLVGSSDGLAEAVAAGATEPGVIAATYGTTATLTAFHPVPGPAAGLWRTEGFGPERTMVAGGLSASGAVAGWFLRELARDLPQDGQDAVAASLRTLSAEAADVPPGGRGLLMLPYLHGERTPFDDPAARGVVVGLHAGHTRADLYRAALESVAFGVRHLAEALREVGVPLRRLRTAGGMAADPTWMRIVTDVTGLDHELLAEPDGAPYGIARLAARTLGHATGEGTAWSRPGDLLRADPRAHAVYERPYALFRRLYEDTRAVVHALADGAAQGATT